MPDTPADPPAPPGPAAASSRALLWATLLSLLTVVGLAFALLVSHQVRQADARRSAAQVQLAAFEDCLQFVQGSTIASCTSRLGRHSAPPVPVGNALLESAATQPLPSAMQPMSIAVR